MADTYCKLGANQHVIHSFNDEIYVNLCCESKFPKHSVLLEDTIGFLNIRNALANGVKHSHCEGCWRNEKNGIKSHRQLTNEYIDETQYRMEIYFDNTCDLACVYCNASYSSKWEQEYNKASPADKRILTIVGPDNAVFKSSRKQSEKNFSSILSTISDVGKLPHRSTAILLLGGETLLTPFVKDNLIKKVIEAFYSTASVDKMLWLNLNTNGNTPDSIIDKTIAIVEEMKCVYPNLNFNICFSIESVGNIAEYVRYGLSWSQFDKNVDKWFNTPNHIQFNLALNNLSFFNTPACLTYMFDKARNRKYKDALFQFSIHPVTTPAILSIAVLSKKYEYVLDQIISTVDDNKHLIDDSTYAGVMSSVNSFRAHLGHFSAEQAINIKTELKNYTDYIERVRGLRLDSINPILAEFLDY